MKRLLLTIPLFLMMTTTLLADQYPPLRVKESDGSPNIIPVNELWVNNGSLAQNGPGRATLNISAGNLSGLGTGVATALAINIGLSGAVSLVDGTIGAATGTSLVLTGGGLIVNEGSGDFDTRIETDSSEYAFYVYENGVTFNEALEMTNAHVYIESLGTASTTLGTTAGLWVAGGNGANKLGQIGIGYGAGNITSVAPAILAWKSKDSNAYEGDFIIALADRADYTTAPTARLTIDEDTSNVLLAGNLTQLGGTTGGSISAASGVFTIAGIGNTNNENLLLDFEGTANEVGISTSSGVIDISIEEMDLNIKATSARSPNIHLDASVASNLIPSVDMTADRGSLGQQLGRIQFLNTANGLVADIYAARGSTDDTSQLIFRTDNDTAMVTALTIEEDQDAVFASEITSAETGALGWSIQAGADTACNTTCTFACVHGWETSAGEVAVACDDATADKCLCAGAN